MAYIDNWAKTKKTPIPRSYLVSKMKSKGVKTYTTVNALNCLLQKGYIRRACDLSSKTFFIQLRGLGFRSYIEDE